MSATTGGSDDTLSEGSLPGLVAWVSLCMLAAALGPLLEVTVRQIWVSMGAFGLAAAVGLDVASRTRAHRHQCQQRKAAQIRLDRHLTDLTRQHVTTKELREAISRIANDVHPHDGKLARRSERRLLLECPVRVRLLNEGETWGTDSPSDAFIAHVRDISANGVGLVHTREVYGRQGFLTFELTSGETISLVAEPVWCSPQADGRHQSGWKLLEVAPPNSLASCLTETQPTSLTNTQPADLAETLEVVLEKTWHTN